MGTDTPVGKVKPGFIENATGGGITYAGGGKPGEEMINASTRVRKICTYVHKMSLIKPCQVHFDLKFSGHCYRSH